MFLPDSVPPDSVLHAHDWQDPIRQDRRHPAPRSVCSGSKPQSQSPRCPLTPFHSSSGATPHSQAPSSSSTPLFAPSAPATTTWLPSTPLSTKIGCVVSSSQLPATSHAIDLRNVNGILVQVDVVCMRGSLGCCKTLCVYKLSRHGCLHVRQPSSFCSTAQLHTCSHCFRLPGSVTCSAGA